MGSAKKNSRNGRAQSQIRRTTRSSKGRLLSDPAQNTQLLTEQLRSLGLYASPTLGDGNCLFRALSDQLYGTPSHHSQLRQDICDWIEGHKPRYEPFVEDERGFEEHLRCMRENATYGGHLELSAFAHLTRRNVKVVQPGLVYVIEWTAGGDPDPADVLTPADDDPTLNDREKRRLRRDKKRAEKEKAALAECTADEEISAEKAEASTVYVAYHDWEHFSSIRNLRGPHAGLPSVSEISAESEPPVASSSTKKKSTPKSQLKVPISKSSPKRRSFKIKEEPPLTPLHVPLPASRSPSPTSLPEPITRPQILTSTPASPTTLSTYITPATPMIGEPVAPSFIASSNLRVHRSPKRTFDESSGSSDNSESLAKRSRNSRRSSSGARRKPLLKTTSAHDVRMIVDDLDQDESTPGLSAPGSSSESQSSSEASSPQPAPSPASSAPPSSAPSERPLTRRQRKALGLPKSRAALLAARSARTVSAGKIVVPGGRYKKSFGRVQGIEDGHDEDEADEETGEWRTNGTGRVDVRGFRELKI